MTTNIEWTRGDDGSAGVTWNPTTGCDRVSAGCDNCYALTMAKRLKGMGSAKYQTDGDPKTSGPGFGLAMHVDTLADPLGWKKPKRVFVNSMSDLFHKGVSDEFIAGVFAVMALTPQHTFQILTKRHARLRSLLADECKCGKGHVPGTHFRSAMAWAVSEANPDRMPGVPDDAERRVWASAWPLRNAWLGVSVEDQKWADIRIPALVQTPAAVRFLSCEPLIGPVKLNRNHAHCPTHDFPGGFCSSPCPDLVLPDWVIVGGESGPGARRFEVEWAADLILDARLAGAAPFVKQLGSVWARENGASDKKGGDPADWPAELRIREFPKAAVVAVAS